MALALDPSVPLACGLKRLARRQLADALERVDLLIDAATDDAPDVDEERQIHEARKRCKEVRAIARLVESEEGRDAERVDRLVRRAARRLSASRDAAVLLRTLQCIADRAEPADAATVRDVATRFATGGQTRVGHTALVEARSDLRDARRRIKRWQLSDGDAVVRRGLAATMRGARRRWIAAASLQDEEMHSWRTVNKRWWYQARLVEAAAPQELGPMITRLDAVGELLGDVHDLDVLLERLGVIREHDDDAALGRVVELVETRRAELAGAAMDVAAPLFVEGPGHAARRIVGHWRLAVQTGITLAPDATDEPVAADDAAGEPVERERKYLVASPPASATTASHLRQGYLAVDGATSVRVRSADGGAASLTVKVGAGTTRHEFERSIDDATFDALWPLTEGRRVDKERFVRSHGGHTIEIDVFHDRLDGLVVAEVEFDDDEAMSSFEPPDWFGPEVSDDIRYTNARLAIDGLPDG